MRLTTQSLSRDELIRLAVQKKLKQVAKEQYALRLFKPNKGPQEEFLRSNKRLSVLFGGNRTGKSEAGAIRTLRNCLGLGLDGKPTVEPRDAWVISPTFEVQRDSAQEKILKYLPTTVSGKAPVPTWRSKAQGYLDRIEFMVARPGYGAKKVSISFKSADQGYKAFQGASVPFAWFDEEAPLDVFTEVMMRTLDNKGTIIGTMTPLQGDMYDLLTDPEGDFSDDPELEYWHMTWNDNPYLSESEKKRLWALIPEEEREMRVEGRFVPREGRVVREFSDMVHVVDNREPGPNDRKIGGFDYGMRTPSAYIEVFVDTTTGIAYAYREHYAAELTTEQHAGEIKRIRVAQRIKADPSLWNRQPDGKSVAESMRMHGVYLTKASRGAGTWSARMDRVRGALRFERSQDGLGFALEPQLFICRNCTNLLTEMRKLRWRPTRSGNNSESTLGPDHAIDALGYALEDLAYILGKKDAGSVKVTRKGRYVPRNKVTGY